LSSSNFSLLSLSWETFTHPGMHNQRILLDGLIYNLKSFLQLTMFQELQIFAFVCTYSDAG
jgi:hypothetical protein